MRYACKCLMVSIFDMDILQGNEGLHVDYSIASHPPSHVVSNIGLTDFEGPSQSLVGGQDTPQVSVHQEYVSC